MSEARRLAAVLVTALAGALLLTSPAGASPLRGAPAGGTFSGGLSGVSCPGTATCWAVGTAGNGFAAADRWDGSAWAVKSLPRPQGATISSMKSVSCAGLADCWAVGSYQKAAGELAFAEHWNGARWSVVAVPSVATATNTALIAVSCPGTATCWAVGTSDAGPLFERWNGQAWAIVPVPDRQTIADLFGVSCAATSDCWAVGPGTRGGTRTVHWDGMAWSVVVTATSSTHIDTLTGVSCPAVTACLAVGRALNAPLAEQWNGSAWAVTATVTRRAALFAVSCTATFRCAAVGFTVGPSSHAFSEIWNGSQWRQVVPALPPGTRLSPMDGVSCAGPADCWAVGSKVATGGSQSSLIEHWNGTAWSIAA